jgi:hypothetical protein
LLTVTEPPARVGRGILTRKAIKSVLAGGELESMRMMEIHGATELLLDREIPRSTIKDCLAHAAKDPDRDIERVDRGRYRLRT